MNLEFTEKEIFKKLFALERLIKHLENNKNDPRKKERARTTIAVKTLDKFLKEGEDEYDRGSNFKISTTGN